MHSKRCLLTSALCLAVVSAAHADDAAHLAALKKDPTHTTEAATWFMGLPIEKKKEYAAQLGRIVLETDDEFVVAFGAEKAPYPWTFVVGAKRLDLSEYSSFDFVLRDDEWVQEQWGVHWSYRWTYRTRIRDGRVVFEKLSPRHVGSVWVPSTGWRYVGPKLPKSTEVLRSTPVNEPPENPTDDQPRSGR